MNTMTNTDDMIKAYSEWMMQESNVDGRELYYINIMFHSIRGSCDVIIDQMKRAIYGSPGSFYSRLCTRFAHHPERMSQQQYLPHAFLFFDLPVYKKARSRLNDVVRNDGLHVNGIVATPRISRMRHALPEEVAQYQSLYAKNGIQRVHVMPIDHTPEVVVDYAMKTIKSSRLEYDPIILPRAFREVHGVAPVDDPQTRLIKDIQSATNLSDEAAQAVAKVAIMAR
jgi:hypothetical protein